MGAHAYWYFVPYQRDYQAALDELRDREREAGQFNPVTPFPKFPVETREASKQQDGAWDDVEELGEAGTRSILDIHYVGLEPDFGVACILPSEQLETLYGTRQPTRDMIERDLSCLDDVERGHCILIAVYQDGKPNKLFFAGYSFD